MTKKLINKIKLWAYAIYNDALNPDDTVSLTKLVQKQRNTPYYNRQGVPDHWFTDRTAAFYIQRVFGDDQTILDKLGIKPENVKHIFWEANSRGTDLDYYTIWKKGGLNINGPKPHENKIDYKGGIITLIPPQKIKDKLYIDGGEKKEDMHIALAYLPYPWNSNVVEIISNFSLPPSIGKLTGKLEKFGAKEEDKFAIVATIEIHGIDEWRNMFIPVMEEKRLIVSNNFPIFIPHVTLKYIGKDEELPQKEIPQEDFEFDRLEVWDKDKRTVIKDFTKDVEKSNWNNEIQEIKKMDLVDRINWWKINKSIISSNEEKLNYYINAFKN